MSETDMKLKELGITLQSLPRPKGNYLLYKQVDQWLYLSGQSAFIDGQPLYPGLVGSEVTPEQAYCAAREVGVVCLSILKQAVGDLDKVEIVKVLGFVASAPEFDQQPTVLNGISDLLVAVLGQRGRHVRAAIGTARLPFNCCVEVELMARILP